MLPFDFKRVLKPPPNILVMHPIPAALKVNAFLPFNPFLLVTREFKAASPPPSE